MRSPRYYPSLAESQNNDHVVLPSDDDTAFIELLVKIFDMSQIMGSALFFLLCPPEPHIDPPLSVAWLAHFEAAGNTLVLSKLKRISEFFYQVLCAFVIRDFNMLLERYLKKTRQAYISPV